MRVTKLQLSPVKIRIFAQTWHFCSFWAGSTAGAIVVLTVLTGVSTPVTQSGFLLQRAAAHFYSILAFPKNIQYTC